MAPYIYFNSPMITSLQNTRVKDAVHLRSAKQRQRQGRIIIDGTRELSRAVQAGVRMIEIFVCESLLVTEESESLVKKLETCGGEILPVSEAVFQKLAFGSREEGVLGVAVMPQNSLADLDVCFKRPHPNPLRAPTEGWSGEGTIDPKDNPLIVVLEGVEKPGNIGAVLRSADAAGVSALILADARTDLYNPNAIRASLGTIFTVPVCEAASGDVLSWLREKNISIVAARVDGSVPYTDIDYRGPTALVLGSEAEGLTSAWTCADIRAVRLPMLGAADSLNVSVTAAVIFYEALRQRRIAR
jgi:RNA methyltransferase, TrmH family